ncbi:hypothetical protein CapIbe_020593 [Capra ibex]
MKGRGSLGSPEHVDLLRGSLKKEKASRRGFPQAPSASFPHPPACASTKVSGVRDSDLMHYRVIIMVEEL